MGKRNASALRCFFLSCRAYAPPSRRAPHCCRVTTGQQNLQFVGFQELRNIRWSPGPVPEFSRGHTFLDQIKSLAIITKRFDGPGSTAAKNKEMSLILHPFPRCSSPRTFGRFFIGPVALSMPRPVRGAAFHRGSPFCNSNGDQSRDPVGASA